MKTPVKATWTIELNCDCPKCGEYVNLLDYPDFWDNRQFVIGENKTDNSNGVEVFCPKCDHEFEVDLEY